MRKPAILLLVALRGILCGTESPAGSALKIVLKKLLAPVAARLLIVILMADPNQNPLSGPQVEPPCAVGECSFIRVIRG